MTILPFLLTLALAQAGATASQPAAPAAREIAPDTYLIPGAMLPDRGPDGNTVVFTGPSGLVVVDTGRHPWHSDGILAFARERRQPIAAIINTHWHLDHSSGNRRLKAAHPQARVYTTRAVDRAIAPGGFLARNFAAAKEKPLDASAPPTRREETALFLATMEASESLKADVPIERSATMTLAGRPLSVRVATDAVTDADVWLYDEQTRVAVVGDLVTFPSPFFESACPAGWQAALDAVWATPFQQAVPGHGEVMTRDQFDAYRQAFASFRSCVGSGRKGDRRLQRR
jgi:glyoxylase-like metal-dependent hydrolase (beta-lactamase superfamily II)